MKTVISIIKKDLLSEFRSRDMFVSMFTFSLIIIFVFNLVLDLTSNIKNLISPAALWITFLFSGSIGLSRSYSLEKESEAIKGILLAPVDRSLIYLGKFFSNLIFLLIVEFITVPIFIILFNYEFGMKFIEITLVIILGTIGFSTVGTLFSAISLNTRLREVLLPILYFPIIIPILLNAVRVTSTLLAGGSLSEVSSSLQVLIAFDIIFLSAGVLLYEYVIEES
ncbi:MAG: heme ABC transporter permease [Candidatus Dadabacteria bacterium]|nr:heme ABC transporter permease [Candidatus Dadabacteria bacterium]NIS08766.1 heme ABC transporter permease [Candidatus Dadabacteria bacterium]NIV42709.1 heme ABC transporter permease [Candidatus Dadabacteria bacterium]NIX15452.1 heme ABC transporter permease [Candidatus Dadabacteria bacterium]NIY22114.1 heme ABC transporter permease [Candidatus Dadabacteria bacterium]